MNDNMLPAKPQSHSKTNWFNALITAAGIAATALPTIRDTVSEHPGWAGIALVINGLIGIGLRQITNQPVKTGGG